MQLMKMRNHRSIDIQNHELLELFLKEDPSLLTPGLYDNHRSNVKCYIQNHELLELFLRRKPG